MSHLDVTDTTFERDVLERSKEVPVVVDFWADWCGPCRALGPVLEKLADEDDAGFELAKVDVDANQGLSRTFGIQSIPYVMAFKDGRPVADFVGALPESSVREWLTQLGPSPADEAYESGRRAEESGDTTTAMAEYEKATLQDPGHLEARTALARLELADRAAGLDEDELRTRVGADPSDIEAAIGLSDVVAARGELADAYDVVLNAIRENLADDRERARLHLLTLLDLVPADDPRAVEARRALSRALF